MADFSPAEAASPRLQALTMGRVSAEKRAGLLAAGVGGPGRLRPDAPGRRRPRRRRLVGGAFPGPSRRWTIGPARNVVESHPSGCPSKGSVFPIALVDLTAFLTVCLENLPTRRKRVIYAAFPNGCRSFL